MSQGRDLPAPTCPNCGARLQAPPGPGARIACHYCGQTFEPIREVNPAPRVIIVAPGARNRRPIRSGGARSVFNILFSLVVLGIVAFFSTRQRSQAVANLSSKIVAAAVAPFYWDAVAGPPVPFAIGSGVEGFVGRLRKRGDDTLWVIAYDSSKLTPIWQAGPLGTFTQGYMSTLTSVVGHVVLVTDYHAKLHEYDAASGRETRSVTLSDRAKSMCASPDGKDRVWLEISDEKDVMLDVDSGTLTPSPRPAWCPDLWATNDDCRGSLKRGAPRLSCKGPENAPKVAGFEAKNVVEEPDLAVALGRKHPGTGTPIAVGFDPKTKAVRWQMAVGSGDQANVSEQNSTSVMDALAGGRFVATYELTSKGWHFTALDARSGQRQWDVALPPSLLGSDDPQGLTLSPSRLYVMRTSTLNVYDAKTGALVGTIGG